MSALDTLFDTYPTHLKVGDVAAIFGVAESTVYRWLNDQDIPAYKIGSTWVILRDEVREHVKASNERGPSDPSGGAARV